MNIEIKAEFPGCGKTYTLCLAFAKFPSKHKYYIVPQNKQKQDVIDLLKTMGMNSPNVKTIDEFLGNWKRVNHNGEIRFLKTDKVSRRAPTKKQIDLFIDEFSSVSNKTMEIITNNFNIRNLIVAGDSHQFDPIEFKCEIFQIGSNTKKEYTYEDDGSLPNIEFNTTYVLTKPMRAIDHNLQTLLKAIKNADSETIWEVIKSRQWKGNKKATDLHIAYTNKVVNKVNAEYASEFDTKQYTTINNDKAFNVMKGRLLNETEYNRIIAEKKAFLEDLEAKNEIKDAKDELQSWITHMFGYAFAVTSHKLQGATIRNRDIIIHLNDILDFALMTTKDKELSYEEKEIELERRLDIFHKLLYVACSRATDLSQIHFETSSNIKDALDNMSAFTDNDDINTIRTTSEDFNFDKLFETCDLIEAKTYNKATVDDAINMSYKEFSSKYQISQRAWKSLRAAARAATTITTCPSLEGHGNVTYKSAEMCPMPLEIDTSIFHSPFMATVNVISEDLAPINCSNID